MSNSRTPKIVVGVGLVVAYAAGLTFLTVRDDNAITRSPPSAVSAQTVAAPASAGTLASDAPAPEANAPAVTSAPIAPEVTRAATAPEVRPSAAASGSRTRAEDVPVASLPSPRPKVANGVEESSRSNSGSNAVSELPAAGSAASESVSSAEDKPASKDGQSTPEASTSTIDN